MGYWVRNLLYGISIWKTTLLPQQPFINQILSNFEKAALFSFSLTAITSNKFRRECKKNKFMWSSRKIFCKITLTKDELDQYYGKFASISTCKSGLLNFVAVAQVRVTLNVVNAQLRFLHQKEWKNPHDIGYRRWKVREIVKPIGISYNSVISIHLCARKLSARWELRLLITDIECNSATTLKECLAFFNSNEFLNRFITRMIYLDSLQQQDTKQQRIRPKEG